jgi:hypothetical protein
MLYMPRTYSLAHVMLGITLFCVLCGLFVNDSPIAMAISFLICLVAPTLLVWIVLRNISRNHVAFAMWLGTGAIAGAFIASGALIGGGSTMDRWSQYFEFVLFPLSFPPAVVGFGFGFAELLHEAIEQTFSTHALSLSPSLRHSLSTLPSTPDPSEP